LKAGLHDPPFTAFPPSSKTKTCASPTDEKESRVATAEANAHLIHLNVWAVPNSSFLPFQRNMVKGYNDGKDRTHQGIWSFWKNGKCWRMLTLKREFSAHCWVRCVGLLLYLICIAWDNLIRFIVITKTQYDNI
jgi:hypothetical protein